MTAWIWKKPKFSRILDHLLRNLEKSTAFKEIFWMESCLDKDWEQIQIVLQAYVL